MSDEKTEDATPKRRDKARRDGKVAKSGDFTSVAVMTAVSATMVFSAPPIVASLITMTRSTLATVEKPPPPQDLPDIFAGHFVHAGLSLIPLLAVAFATAALVTYLQVGPVFSTKAISLDPQRMNPAEGLKRLISKDRLVALAKNTTRIGIIGWIAIALYEGNLPILTSLTGRSLTTSIHAAISLATTLAAWLMGVLLVFGVVDLLWQRHSFEKSLRMSKTEVKDEHKESEGDPMLKGKRRRLQQQLLKEVEVRSVRNADALVVNPTHIAVALTYDASSRGAPHIVARGRGPLAKRMRDEAKKWHVPIVQNVPLARGLVGLEINEEVPESLYSAVAEVLNYVYSLRNPKDL